MKNKRFVFWWRGVFALLSCVLFVGAANSQTAKTGDTLYQYSTLNALLNGVFEGDLTLGDLKKQGDFGVGTLNRLDGEMLILDGVAYQVRSDGKVIVRKDDDKTPFACVTFFRPERTLSFEGPASRTDFEKWLNEKLPAGNRMYALRIEGAFTAVKARSYPPVTKKPYPMMKTLTQNVFNFTDIEGVVVGFCLPEYLGGLNVPGYHLHFLNVRRDAGGHLLDYTIKKATIAIDELTRFSLQLPNGGDFYTTDLSGASAADRDKIEKGKE